MFGKILIANRGEIACRVIDTARRLGVATVAVYSEADRDARHVDVADQAFAIGPAPARQSYLDAGRIIDAARRAGVEAIHPGYGFLSENADFAQSCVDAGLIFIGPPAAAIRTMGSKAAAKTLLERSGVPLVPGYHGADQSVAALSEAAERIGYPVLLKASAGGGGRGMRVVAHATDLAEAIAQAAAEARASFGDGHLLLEAYLAAPRHIEIQIFADTHGNVVSLYERDCSIQRRHQKVLEETPAPFFHQAQRDALGAAAIEAARAVGYVGAGTVEFICQDDRFYFMEMNTRLQVEHPVTEMVTGLDLVEWQLRVAAGAVLPETQERIAMRGHAIEARICAEDPARDFLPSTGRIVMLREPPTGPHVRIDTGVREGDAIGPDYDSMIAKLIVWGEDRATAVRRLASALDQYQLAGPQTNLGLLRGIVGHAGFVAGGVDTGFIASHPDLCQSGADTLRRPALAAACVGLLAELASERTGQDGDPFSPWAVADGWQLNGVPRTDLTLGWNDTILAVAAFPFSDGGWRLELPQGEAIVTATVTRDRTCRMVTLALDGARTRHRLVRDRDRLIVIGDDGDTMFTILDPFLPPPSEARIDHRLTAPTPARVVRVLVAAGASVAKGDRLVVLEAMKMETTLYAPTDGVIEAVHVQPDDHVEDGVELLRFVVEQAP